MATNEKAFSDSFYFYQKELIAKGMNKYQANKEAYGIASAQYEHKEIWQH